MLARRLTTILPAMTLAEAIETTRIHSVAGLTGDRTALVTTRPFRAPASHHLGCGADRRGPVPLCGQACALLLIGACWADEDIAEGPPFSVGCVDRRIREGDLAGRPDQ